MTLQGFNEAVLSELFIIRVVGFGYAVGVEGEGVAWAKLAFSNFAIPILEDSQDRGGGLQALDCIIAAEEQGGEMAAIGVPQMACGGVVFREGESGETAVRRVATKELVHGAQEALGVIAGDAARA